MPLVLTLPEHLSSPQVFSGIRVTRSLVLWVCFVDRCLSFCTFSFGHCVVCSSSIYGFWLLLWYLQALLICKPTVLAHLYITLRPSSINILLFYNLANRQKMNNILLGDTSLMFIGVCVAHLFSCMCFCFVHPSYVYCAQWSYKCPSIVHCPFPLTFVFIQKSTWLRPIMLSEFVTFQMFDEIVACQ